MRLSAWNRWLARGRGAEAPTPVSAPTPAQARELDWLVAKLLAGSRRLERRERSRRRGRRRGS